VRRSHLAALLLTGALALAACGEDATTGSAGSAAPSPPPASSPAGSSLLDLTVDTVSGGPLALSQYEGKPVAFWFWAPG